MNINPLLKNFGASPKLQLSKGKRIQGLEVLNGLKLPEFKKIKAPTHSGSKETNCTT